MSEIDNTLKKEHTRFHNSLIKNSGGSSRSVCLYGGAWNFSAFSFAQSLLSTCNLSIYVLSRAHPLTNKDNVKEINTNLTGSLSESNTSERFFFTSPVYLGEMGFDGEMHFGFAHNAHFFIMSKLAHAHEKETQHDMFHNLTHIDFPTYRPPEGKDTGSEIEDNFVLASFVRGEKILRAFSKTAFITGN